MGSEVPRDAAATRERILGAAKSQFAALGYDRTTVRAVAREARVSANLITRYFGGKDGLFRAATELDMRVSDALRGPKNAVGARIAAHVVARWQGAQGSDPLLTMLRAAMTDANEAKRMAAFFQSQAADPIANYLGGEDRQDRAAAMCAFIMGTVAQRYVLTTGPLAGATSEQLAAWLGVNLQKLADTRTSGGSLLPHTPVGD